MKITTLKSHTIPFAETQKAGRLPGRFADARNADSRIEQATGQSYDEANQGLGDWMWEKARGGYDATQDFLGQQVTMDDVTDLAKSGPSAVTRVGENFLGQVGDAGGLRNYLTQLINDKMKGSSNMDMSLDLMRQRGMGSIHAPTSEDIHGAAKQALPGALTYEPQGPLGQILHTGADFVDPTELGAGGAVRGIAKRFR